MAKKYNPLVKMGFETKGILTVNRTSPDENGNVEVEGGVLSVNDIFPDENGNVVISSGNNIIISTLTEILELKGDANLIPGSIYAFGGNFDVCFFQAIIENELAITGSRIMRCPSNYSIINNWLGIWSLNINPTINSLVIWGGKVWRNTTGEVGYSIDFTSLDEINWELVDPWGQEYVSLVFGIDYDWNNQRISKQWDNKGNVFGILPQIEGQEWRNYNIVDICDWNNPRIRENNVWGVFNNNCNVNIIGNKNFGAILENSCTLISNNINHGHIWGNSNSTTISNNKCTGDILFNSNNGHIRNNSNKGSISNNSNNGNIGDNANVGNDFLEDGSIIGNSNNGGIFGNSNEGWIYQNTNTGNIRGNTNRGSIKENSNLGDITDNKNNGGIFLNSSSGECHINRNINNGDISGSWGTENITDTIVNKGEG